MRKPIIGALVAVFGPLAALVLGRVMSAATSTAWQLAGAACAAAGWFIVCLSDPVHRRLMRLGAMVSTIVVMLGAALLSGIAWVIVGLAMRDQIAPATALVVDYEIRPPPTEVKGKVFGFPVRPDSEVGIVWTSGGYTIRYDESSGPLIVYYCTVANKGNASVLEADLVYRTTFFERGVNRSPAVGTYLLHARVPALAAGETFAFYISNGSNLGALVEPPREAVGRAFGQDKLHKIEVLPGAWGWNNLLFNPPNPPKDSVDQQARKE
jgi:hypothetical protein